jgi:hypothetical protein
MRGAYKKELKVFFVELNNCIVKENRDQKGMSSFPSNQISADSFTQNAAFFSTSAKVPETAKPAPSPSPGKENIIQWFCFVLVVSSLITFIAASRTGSKKRTIDKV